MATLLAASGALAAPAKPASPAQRSAVGAATVVQIAMPQAAPMRTLVFKPAGPGPFKVLLYAHGRPAYASQRAQLAHPISYGHVRYWLGKGYAVVAPIRPGYGPASAAGTAPAPTPDAENSGVGYSTSGQCLRSPQPERTAQAAALAQRAALDWVRQQPWARQDHIVLEGQSVGGLATVALCAANPPGVRGCINFAGGAGGDPLHAPGRMCAPEKITQLMRGYGLSTRPPSIWLYAPNDLYWGSEPPRQWHAAFNLAAKTAHASPSTLVRTPAIGSDGHNLQRAGSAHWGPPLSAWLRANKL